MDNPDQIKTDEQGRTVEVKQHVFLETQETKLGGGATTTETKLFHW